MRSAHATGEGVGRVSRLFFSYANNSGYRAIAGRGGGPLNNVFADRSRCSAGNMTFAP